MKATGKVFLIGAGPGDIELLTMKAAKAIGQADIILMDSLANPDVLDYAKPNVRVEEVGKRGGRHSIAQTEIQERLAHFARLGLTVARIKGGDPSIFGRGGEEVQFLQENGIDYEVVAGVTAASGIAAALGISLTHRDSSHSLIYLAGPHFAPPAADLNLPPLANFNGTIVVYMALKSCVDVTTELISRGLRPDIPAVAVQSGTLDNQRCAFAPLERLNDAVQSAGLSSPVLLIIGEVVALSPLYSQPQQATTVGERQ